VIAVCIKAGTKTFAFNQDGTDGCYTVTGLGTTRVSVTQAGRVHDDDDDDDSSRYCADISNVVFYFDCGGPPG
jgi:hypothetical protein